MKTDALIAMLASGADVASPVPPGAAGRATTTLGAGLLASVALMAMLLGVRPNLEQLALLPDFWIKVGFVAAITVASWHAAHRLCLPAADTRALPLLIAMPLLLMWALGAISMNEAPPEQRAELFWGATWRSCPLLIAMLALPILAAALRLMRQLAPTRLRLAGAAAGFAAGCMAALVYCLHCPELAASFVGFWYVLGMLVPTAIGAAIGPKVLAW
ncbi:NrsF family protein [Janthinobacterium sp. HLX7-2]|uniref:NrsF family protein n=1 Tax=Janthinobacterium sp. HLX7-2 TaxID=1259331 RepID=UPI003F2751A3